MRGYVEHLLRIETDPEGGHDADARVLGTIAHRALEEFFRERRDAQVDPSRMDAADRARLKAIVDEHARPYLEGGEATGHLAALRANVTWLQRSLVRTVTGLARNPPVPGAVPRYFELKVGTRGWEDSEEKIGPARIRAGARELWIGGEIDRVDEGPGVRVVVDYKHSTGRAVWAKLKPENLFETHFQLPLYLRALEQNGMKTPDDTELLAYLVSLRDAAASRVLGEGGVLRSRLLDEDAPTGLGQSLARVLEPIFAGAVAPDEGGHCYSCRLRRICRVPVAAERGLDDAPADPPGDGEAS
jgi:ATP-dependent helicase/DNAse subunit B